MYCITRAPTCQPWRQRGAARSPPRRAAAAAAAGAARRRPRCAPPPSCGGRARTPRTAAGSGARPPTARPASPPTTRWSSPRTARVCLWTESPLDLLAWFWKLIISDYNFTSLPFNIPLQAINILKPYYNIFICTKDFFVPVNYFMCELWMLTVHYTKLMNTQVS